MAFITEEYPAYQIEEADRVLIDDDIVEVVGIVDEIYKFVFLFLDNYGDTFEKTVLADDSLTVFLGEERD